MRIPFIGAFGFVQLQIRRSRLESAKALLQFSALHKSKSGRRAYCKRFIHFLWRSSADIDDFESRSGDRASKAPKRFSSSARFINLKAAAALTVSGLFIFSGVPALISTTLNPPPPASRSSKPY